MMFMRVFKNILHVIDWLDYCTDHASKDANSKKRNTSAYNLTPHSTMVHMQHLRCPTSKQNNIFITTQKSPNMHQALWSTQMNLNQVTPPQTDNDTIL